MSALSMLGGTAMTLRESLLHRSSLHSSFRPHASTAARVPVANLLWRFTTLFMPSAASMLRDSRSPNSRARLGVYGVEPFLLVLDCHSQSKYMRFMVFFLLAAMAFSETATRPRPVGSDRAFWEPVTATSTPHASILNGSAPMDDTPSTRKRASDPAASMVSRMRGRSEVMPVAVSLCTTATALVSLLAFRNSASFSSLAPSPQGQSMT
mmetsp:Transcript_9024/g.27050  ORF Transcript_9024/g.27050 Transcript_9024/m.27050 type:complete len:209 (-) Transcript_9024:612-1238(-)